MISGINHITIAIKDLEKSFAFYRDVLGFRPLMKHSKGAYFLAGETWFCLELDSQARAVELPEDTHFAFGVSQEGFAAARERIIQSGAKSWKVNKSEGDSHYFLDLDGHKLEIHVGDWRSRLQSAKEKPWNDSLVFFDPPPEPRPSAVLSLEVLPEILAVARLQPSDAVPRWALRSSFFSISKTDDELSVVCRQTDLPDAVSTVERNWRALKVQGPLDFALTGILASLAEPLARAGVSLFAISTFDTDYLLVRQDKLALAISVLEGAGHRVQTVFADSTFLQPELRSPRLVLEPITEAHAAELCDLLSDEGLHAFVPSTPLSLDQQRERCAKWALRRSPDSKELWLNWLAREVSTGRPVGHFQAGSTKERIASIGYVVAQSYQGQGMASEALRVIFDYLQTTLNAVEVKAWSDTRNMASHRVAAKLGMTQVDFIKDADFFKGATSDEFVFSKVFREKE